MFKSLAFDPGLKLAAAITLAIIGIVLFTGCEAMDTIDPATQEPVIVGQLESGQQVVRAVDEFVPPGPWKLGTAGIIAALGLAAEVFRRKSNRNEKTADGVVQSVDDLLEIIDKVNTPEEAKAILKKTQKRLGVQPDVDKLKS